MDSHFNRRTLVAVALTGLVFLGVAIYVLHVKGCSSDRNSFRELHHVTEYLETKNMYVLELRETAAITALGCEVVFNPFFVHCREPQSTIPLMTRVPEIRHVLFADEHLGNELSELVHLNDLESLTFIRCRLPCSLGFLNGLPRLRKLYISEGDLSDEQLQNVRLPVSITHVRLAGNPRVSERGMQILSDVSSLRELDLHGSSISNVEFLAGISVTERLLLAATLIDDAAVPRLAAMTQLGILDLRGTNLTATGVAAIRESLLNCKVLFEGPGVPDVP